ncbi:uncharacterized protein A1O9_07753 [Exophiala aquamarina CBS 119918]|uniref:Elongator complex protein 1 n=1 Tax=Exophiala aquamarina CBS 119918 TaxID=1182545 RepID=A0A072P8V5_9EURO|nr:uncharacterized protein A1O9_07753 [Exophiala aquamarina CBS 119918]KEF56172.1 hypothetical protein A1O9_07753 [Exophiala aquamarina CBS 119918]
MRNLKTIAYHETRLDPKVSSRTLPLTATAWDTANDTVICAFGPTPTQPVIELKRRRSNLAASEEAFIDITSWDAPCPLPDLESDEILLLQHFSDAATSCLVLAGGDVIVVREEPLPDQEKIEIVGSVDVGICAATWAPDEELLAIVTRADTLVLMSRTFEPLNEATLSADDLKASKHVSVGWGKKETQFQGKRAKAMRDPTMPERVDEGLPSPHEDGKVTVSWRGDGQYFAINSVVHDHRRVIRVFSREAVLDSASEPVDGLESALSWKPSGNLIAGIKRSETQIEVVFFERNGLRHGQFDLRTTQEDMATWASSISLDWNTDSTVLALSFKDRIQFWTVGNYHYYLKQEIFLPSLLLGKIPLRWHPETPLRTTFAEQSSILDLTFHFSTSIGSTIPPNDHGIVAVIDGRTLKITPFKQAGIPPPMAFCEVNFDYSITDCAISRDGQWLAVLTTHTLEFCKWAVRTVKDTKSSKATTKFMPKMQSYSLLLPGVSTSTNTHLRYTQVALKGTEVYILAPHQGATSTVIRKAAWYDSVPFASFDESYPGSDVIVSEANDSILVDTAHEAVFVTNSTASLTQTLYLPSVLDHMRLALPGAQPNSTLFRLPDNSDLPYSKVSLSPQGTFYADKTLLARDCTSFIVTDAHLIFTTAQHLLKFVHLTNPTQMQVPGDTPEVDERCRSIERGARIITVIPSIYAVVLQMPRGNLETIYPRVLVVSGIRQLIRLGDYLAAFLACQTHQVDLNILHDYDPEMFLSQIATFIDQLKKPSRVDEFLSKLKDEDVTDTLYRDTLKKSPTAGLPAPADQTQRQVAEKRTSKVNRIADAFISILSTKASLSPNSANNTNHLQNLITAHVSKRPADLDAALTLISTLLKTSPSEADAAISHLCFLTPDTNRLFDAALALYDLQLTLLVAQSAQRDPREYMPFLESLSTLSELRRRYQIDNHLRRYAKALASLHAIGLNDKSGVKECDADVHEEAEKYTVRHGLYTEAMGLYRYDVVHLARITRLYAEHLAGQESKHSAAATLFESLGDHAAAYPLYALAHRWREALSCASLVEPALDRGRLRNLATSLATTCADESRDYRSAASIHAEYLSDIPGAALLLCRGSYFADALRLLSLHRLKDQIPMIVDGGLTEKFGEILELVADCKTQLASQVPRIHELRRKKKEDPLAFYGGDPSSMLDGVDIPDNVSLAPTNATTQGGQSLFTRYGSNASKFGGTVASNVSRKTSKTKRREERKRARGKKDSVYEEEYLVASVQRLIQRVNGIHEEVGRLVSGLLRRGLRDQAEKVDEVLREITKLCERARVDVWEVKEEATVVIESKGSYDVNGEGRPSGADGILWDSQHQSQEKREAPDVTAWASNELL